MSLALAPKRILPRQTLKSLHNALLGTTAQPRQPAAGRRSATLPLGSSPPRAPRRFYGTPGPSIRASSLRLAVWPRAPAPTLLRSAHTTTPKNHVRSVLRDENLTTMQKLRNLFKTHGWTALGVYLALSAIDLALTFCLVWAVGADRVRDAEDWVLERLKWKRRAEHDSAEHSSPAPTSEPAGPKSMMSTVLTTAVVAYAIHKTILLPLRAGVTLAVTPKVARILEARGWKKPSVLPKTSPKKD